MPNPALLLVACVVLPVMGLCVWMLHSFLVPIALGMVFAAVLHPFQRWFEKRCTPLASYSVFVVMLCSCVGVFAPLAGLSFLLFKTLSALAAQNTAAPHYQDLAHMLQQSLVRLEQTLEAWGLPIPTQELLEDIPRWAQEAAQTLLVGAGKIAVSTPHFAIAVCIFLATLYFLLRDGPQAVQWVVKASPFSPHHTHKLLADIQHTLQSAVSASIATSAVQSGMVWAALLVFHVPNATVLAALAFMMAFIPVIGNVPITVGSAWYLFSIQHTWQSVAMLLVALLVSLSDNVVRPWIQSKGSHTHPLLTFLAVFGGLSAFGASGIFLGPTVMTLCVGFLHTYSDWKKTSG
jgi:predicted PurR-regulated permease PerM